MADKIPLKLTTGPNEIREFAAGDTVGTAHLPSTVVYTSGAQTLVDKTLDPTTVASQLMAVGVTPARVVEFVSTGTATDYDAVKLTTQAAGNGAIVSAVTSATNADLKVQGLGTGNVLVRNNSTDMGVVVGTTGTQILTNKTLTQPTISNFNFAQHNHTSAAQGGGISAAAISTGSFSQDRIADIANRSGGYAQGRGNAVLIDSTTAANSGGTARWAERSRVAQVQAANYTVSSGVGTATYAACSNLQFNLTPVSGISFNTTPDCIVDTTGGGTTLSNSSKKGKTIRLTLNGSVTATAIRTANLQFRYLLSAAPILTVSLQAASIPIGSHNWTAVAYAVYHGYQNNSGNMHIWIESFKIFQAGASIDGIGVVGSSFTPALIQDGDTTNFDARMQFTVGAASDAILCYNAIWEVLN